MSRLFKPHRVPRLAAVLAAVLAFICTAPALSATAEKCHEIEFKQEETGYDTFKIKARCTERKDENGNSVAQEQRIVVLLNYIHSFPPGGISEKKKNDWAEEIKRPLNITAPILRCDEAQALGERIETWKELPPQVKTAGCMIPTNDKWFSLPLEVDRNALLAGGGRLAFYWQTIDEDSQQNGEPRLMEMTDNTSQLLLKHKIAFDTGLVFTQEASGSWDDEFEVTVSAISSWRRWLQTGAQMRYSTIGAISDVEPEMEDGGDSMGDASGDMMAPEPSPLEFNPFLASDGVVAGDLWASVAPFSGAERFGVLLGVGFSTVPNEPTMETTAKANAYYGFSLSVAGLNLGEDDGLQGSRSYVHLARSHDELFERVLLKAASEDGTASAVYRDESDRWLVKAEVEIPRIGTDLARLLIRFYANIPESGDGPSDIRVSALVSTDPRKWFPNLGGAN